MDADEILTPAEVGARMFAGELAEYEKPWRDRYEFLRSHGYVLRPRYRPGWTPSWHKSGHFPQSCEDYMVAPVRVFLGSICRSDLNSTTG